VVQFKTKTYLYTHAYVFENEYLDKEIRKQTAQLDRFTFRLDRLQKQLTSLKKKMKSVVFGTRKLFKAQHTVEAYQKNPERWKQDFRQARYYQLIISGRKDAKYGNFVFSYNLQTHLLFFTTPLRYPGANSRRFVPLWTRHRKLGHPHPNQL
jgi:anthranilate/para-aminobenzoate synthase component I